MTIHALPAPQIKSLGLQDYQTTWQAMQHFTDQRTEDTEDEIWLVQHPAVFTQGLNGQAKHLLALADQNDTHIPIIQSDRGGQVTYHAPGQIILYILIDLKRAKLGVRALVSLMENAIIAFLADHQITANTLTNAPGVYTNGNKIASLGLKIRKQCSYHGLALNFDMDLTPFSWITPCGLSNMQMAQVSDLLPETNLSFEDAADQLTQHFIQRLQASKTES